MKYTPAQIVRALQYLYYTGDGNNRLRGSPIGDYDYDQFCEQHGIPGNGGGDSEWGYTKQEVKLAELISADGGIHNFV